MLNVVFLGAPGSGKGTQSLILSSNLNIPVVSTGDILRSEIESGSATGIAARKYVELGCLVPDNLVVSIIQNRISSPDCNNGFVIDGFPRSLAQAEGLELMLDEIDKKINLVININVPNDVIEKRVLGRFSCRECGAIYNKFYKNPKNKSTCDICGSKNFKSRDDDKEELSIRSRLSIYNNNIKDLVEFYTRKNLIYSVDGLKSIASVSGEVAAVVSAIKSSNKI